jgi:hypothetical protein
MNLYFLSPFVNAEEAGSRESIHTKRRKKKGDEANGAKLMF